MSRKNITIVHSDGSKKNVSRSGLERLLETGLLKQVAPLIYRLSLPCATFSSRDFSNRPIPKVLPPTGYSELRYLRLKNAAGIHTQEQWIQRVEYFGWRCRYCHIELHRSTLTKDHQIPISDHSTEWASNLVPACKSCNSSKGARRWRVSNSSLPIQMEVGSMLVAKTATL
jgi:hypothetical protein